MRIGTTIALLLAFTLIISAAEPAPLTVSAVTITETRIEKVVTMSGISSMTPGLALRLLVEGPDALKASSYGKIQLETAVDDIGTELKPKESPSMFNDPAKFRDINTFNRVGSGKESKSFYFDLPLNLPARKAAKIKAVKGTFDILTGGEEKAVAIKDIAQKFDKPLDDPALKAAGITITVGNPMSKSKGDIRSLRVELKGSMTAVSDLKILDAAGKSISGSNMSFSSSDQRTTTYSLNEPLDATTTMNITLLVGQKTVHVPFEVKDLTLP